MLFGGNFMDGRGNVTVSLDYTSNGNRRIRERELSEKCRRLGTDSNGAVPGQSFVFPSCESFTYFGISPNGSVSYGDLINTPGAYGYGPNPCGDPWPGEPQTDFYAFDDNGKLKVAKFGFPTDGVLRFYGGDGFKIAGIHDPGVWLEPIEKFNFVQEAPATLLFANATYSMTLTDYTRVSPEAVDAAAGGTVVAPMHGLLLAIEVSENEAVVKGQRLAVLEAMKMQHEITAPGDGVVVEAPGVAGRQVAAGVVMVVLELAD